MSKSKKSNILEFIVLFALLYFTSQFAIKYFFPDQFAEGPTTPIVLKAIDGTVKEDHHPILTLANKTGGDILLTNRCPLPPVDVFFVLNPDSAQEELKELTTEETALPCEILDVIPDGKSEQIDLAPWKYSLFGEMGTYEVRLKIGDDGAVLTLPEGVERPDGLAGELRTRFTIHEAGAPTQMFRTFISKPLLNLLIFIASLMPGYNLGLAIIILTLIVKLVLFLPTQHAMEGQKKMQAVQPQLEAVKHKHKDDPKRMQAETMKLWKEHKVNPFQSCLPMLIQFPILIGLFFVIRDGSVLALSQHLLYSPYQDLSWDFGVQFLSLNLNEPNLYVLPPLLMISQFIQMKMSFAIAKRKKDEKGGGKKPASSQEMQQKMMLYGLPLMIGFFALKFPAAVALYWGVSTLFAIGQQLVVNRKTS